MNIICWKKWLIAYISDTIINLRRGNNLRKKKASECNIYFIPYRM